MRIHYLICEIWYICYVKKLFVDYNSHIIKKKSEEKYPPGTLGLVLTIGLELYLGLGQGSLSKWAGMDSFMKPAIFPQLNFI